MYESRRLSPWLIGLLVTAFAASQGASGVVAAGRASTGQAAEAAACSNTWAGHEADFEKALKEGTIAKMEKVGTGVTNPMRATLDPGTPVARFAWKPLAPGYKNGFMESYKAEIAAYQLDRLLALNMVPPIVERTIDKKTGAAVYWIEHTTGWDAKKPPTGPEPQWSHQIVRMKMLDLLIGNIDRNQGNLIYDADWHLYLIDHSRCFTGKKDLKGMAELGSVDRALWGKVQALTFDSLKAGLGEWVNDNDIKAMLVRRDLMGEAIKKLIEKKGEGATFFD